MAVEELIPTDPPVNSVTWEFLNVTWITDDELAMMKGVVVLATLSVAGFIAFCFAVYYGHIRLPPPNYGIPDTE